jgi:hypothetical protein
MVQLSGSGIRNLLPNTQSHHDGTSLCFSNIVSSLFSSLFFARPLELPSLSQPFLQTCLINMVSLDQEMINPPLFRPDHNKNTLSPNSWIQESLSDPCMFNAVLLAASSHLDFIRRETDNPITQYHYRSTLRLLSHSISRGGQLSHALIAATVHLWHYEVSMSSTEPCILIVTE